MVDSDAKTSRLKFHRVLELIKPKDLMKDDTFLEKIQTYLSKDGISFLITKFHKSVSQFLFAFSNPIQNTVIL